MTLCGGRGSGGGSDGSGSVVGWSWVGVGGGNFDNWKSLERVGGGREGKMEHKRRAGCKMVRRNLGTNFLDLVCIPVVSGKSGRMGDLVAPGGW